MVLAPPPISWRRSPSGRGGPCLPSHDREMCPPRPLPGASARLGRADRTRCRRSRLMRRSFLRPWVIWCRLALKAVRKGGRVVCAGIHMSDIPSFPYRLLWEERQLVSVANLTRQDGIDFLRLAPEIGIVTKTTHLSAQPGQSSPRRPSRRTIRRRGGSCALSGTAFGFWITVGFHPIASASLAAHAHGHG